MEDVIEIAALEDDKEPCIWCSTVEDPLEVYESKVLDMMMYGRVC